MRVDFMSILTPWQQYYTKGNNSFIAFLYFRKQAD